MRAFLSHSSKDKKLVEAVFRSLGSYSSHIDSESFEEGKRSAEEIFRTLGGTDIFVLFGSRQSLVSNWVLHELNVAYDRYASGSIRRFLLFLIDDTTIEDLPAWLRSFHVFRAQKAALIARRIRSHIIELRIDSGEQVDVFIGRELLLKEVLSVLSLPPDESPSILAFAGWPGIGRRTLAKKILAEAYPYLPAIHPQVSIPTGASTEDFYRRILDVSRGLSLAEWRREQSAFEALSAEEKIGVIVDKIVEISTEKEVLFVVDDKGMLASNGEYESWLSKIIAGIPKSIRPMMIFIQQRMTPYAKRRFYQNVYPTHVTSFSDENIRTMLGLLLKQHGVSYTSGQINELMEYLGGHPINVRFAVGLAKQYGLLAVVRDKTDLVNFSLDRATDILLTLNFSLHAEFVCILLSDYQILDLDSIMVLLALSDEDTVTCLKFLEEHAVVERTGKYYQIAPYLQEAISRRFSGKHLDLRKKIAKEIEHIAATYKDEDDIPLPLIDASAIVALKANPDGIPPGWVARFVLPSHLLHVARDAYDDGNHALAASFCEKALKQAAAIPVDAQVEALRLLSLSYARLAKENEFKSTVKRLGTYHGQSAKRNYHFAWGFWYRRIGQYDQAEQEFRAAYKVDTRNFHVLRELATILTHQTRYEEAESYAKAALKIAPTNPFIIDCVCEVIIGKKRTPTMLQKDKELPDLMRDLKKYGDFEGYSFYENRMASYYLSINDYEEAIRFANAAVDRTPKKYSVILNRALILVDCGDKASAQRDLDMLKRLADDDRTGEGKSGKFWVKILEVKLAALDGNYHNAMMKLQGDLEMPQAVHQRVCKDVAWMIENDYNVKDQKLKAWAKKQLMS